LTSAQDVGDWSASRPRRFTLRERVPMQKFVVVVVVIIIIIIIIIIITVSHDNGYCN